MNKQFNHIPVLLQEVITYIQPQPGKRYIDATLGGGGHTKEIVRCGGQVLGIDVDEEALAYAQESVRDIAKEDKVTTVRRNFSDIKQLAQENNFLPVAGILLDLGVSSYQLDTGARGFSFMQDAPLDMRMDQRLGVTAKDLVNALGERELRDLFIRFGEEPRATGMARAIITMRAKRPLETTTQLATIAKRVYIREGIGIHPATRIFQALRIAVNDELYVLEKALTDAVDLLEEKGKLVVISFHSLEDRIVKTLFRRFEEENKGNILTKKPITASEEEVARNPRSRSAKLRVFEKGIK